MTRKKYIVMTILSLLLVVSCIFPMSVSAVNAVSVMIPVTCTGKNTDETFLIRLDPDSTEYQKIDETVLRLKDGEEDRFVISYSYPGTYHYEISQDKGADSKTTYDSTVYLVDVYVTEDEYGKMAAEQVVYLENHTGKKDNVSFVNERELDPEPEQPIDPGSPSDDVPKTGDDSSLVFYFSLFGASTLGLVVLGLSRKGKEKTTR